MPDCGFVFATTGPAYTALALRTAKTLRQHCPKFPIDLYTNETITDPVFDQVHSVNRNWHRPKMEALYRSRFDQTVYLDADLFVIADISDIFDVLGPFDMAAAHDQNRNGGHATQVFTRPFPAVFPHFNCGVLGVCKNEKTDQFIRNWERTIIDNNLEIDQPTFREQVFDSGIRIATLPPEFNVYGLDRVRAWTSEDLAPRIIHHMRLRQHISDGKSKIDTPQALLGPEIFAHFQNLIKSDRYLSPHSAIPKVSAFCDEPENAKLKFAFDE